LKHPSKGIIGKKGSELEGKKVVLCITGSVAAVRSPEIARELMRRGAEVYAVMSPMAMRIIHPDLMEWATGNPVVTELTGRVEHVALSGSHGEAADIVLVVPATANTIGKVACGIDDTPVTTMVSTALGSGIPVIIVPAMHESLYSHPIVKENIDKLVSVGVEFIGPRMEEGKAKIADTRDIVGAVIGKLAARRDLEGKRVLITAGPTIEYIDPIRIITNKSSGKMGVALAEEAIYRGAEVTLIYGPGTATPPVKARVIPVERTTEMYDAVVSELKSAGYDLMIAAAAASDWAPKEVAPFKISSREKTEIALKLQATPKIVDAVKKISPGTLLVVFKAEYNLSEEELLDKGREKMREADADLVVVNDVSREGAGFRSEKNEVFIIDKEGNVVHVPLCAKREIARKILDITIQRFLASS